MHDRFALPALASLLVAVTGALGGCAAESASEELASGVSAIVVCAPGETLTGIDISYYQGNVDFAKVKASGRSFSFARISDGVNHIDNKFTRNWPAMKTAGLVRGAYQFFRPNYDPIAQADIVVRRLSLAGGLKPGDLPPVLDLEVTGGKSPAVVVSRAKQWIARIESKLHVTPIIYTGNNMTPSIGDSFKQYALWLPHYGVDCPRVPDAWSTWTFWQNTDKGSVPGVTGHADTNFFNGGAADLDAIRIPAASLVGSDVDAASDGDRAADDDLTDVIDGDAGRTMGSGARGE